jgi:hypothetical protein
MGLIFPLGAFLTDKGRTLPFSTFSARERGLPGSHRQARLQSSSLNGGLVIWITIKIAKTSKLGFLEIRIAIQITIQLTHT